MSSKHIPARSCVICRAKGTKRDLIRIVKSPDNLAVIDISGKLPGRGCYICPDSECIDRAIKSGNLARSLGVNEIPPAFWQELREHAKNFVPNHKLKLCSILGLARKSGALLIGSDNIENFNHKILLIAAKDCSDGIKKFAEDKQVIYPDLSIKELSQAVGSKGGVQIIGLPLSSGFAEKIFSLNIERSTPFE